MTEAILDLWRANEDASRLYQLYLCRLQMNGSDERVVAVCPQIRRYAARGPGPAEGLFAFAFEIDSLCSLKDYQTAWRRVRRWEEIVHGQRLDLRGHYWSVEDARALEIYYAPLLYFLGRFRHGCELLETSLDFWFTEGKVRSYDLLPGVYNEDEEPVDRCGVTLSHFYGRLGRRLNEWRRWNAFVNGLHQRLFRLSGVDRDDLLADPALLAVLCNKVWKVRNERSTSGVGGSLSDVVESAKKVEQRQKNMQRKLNDFQQRHKPVQERMDTRLRELFPELQGLT